MARLLVRDDSTPALNARPGATLTRSAISSYKSIAQRIYIDIDVKHQRRQPKKHENLSMRCASVGPPLDRPMPCQLFIHFITHGSVPKIIDRN